ncbi:MAG: substrate-binding domain-containing protein [Akkermansiaceae bacterium]
MPDGLHELKKPVASLLADVLRNDLKQKRWRKFLPSELRLVETYRVSRRSVRKALAILTEEGMLSRPSRGKSRQILLGETSNSPHAVRRVVVLTPLAREDMSMSMQTYIREIHTSLRQANVEVVFECLPYQEERFREDAAVRHLEMHKADTWLVIDGVDAVLERLLAMNVPVVNVGGNAQAAGLCHSVSYEIASSVVHAYFLLQRRGHQRLMCLLDEKGGAEHDQTMQRLTHYMIERDISPSSVENFLVSCGSTTADLLTVLEKQFENPLTSPTAVVTSNDSLITVITWLATQRLKVPEDVSIINIGNDHVRDHIVPEIDCYTTPPKPLAQATVNVIQQLLVHPMADVGAKLLECEYQPGDSVKQKLTNSH